MTDSTVNALSVLDSVSTELTIQNETFSIKQFKFLQSLKVLNIVKAHPEVMELIFSIGDETKEVDSLVNTFLQLADIAGDALVQIIQIVTGKDDDWMADLEMDDVLDLSLAVVKVNHTFFTQKLLPKASILWSENSKNAQG